MVPRIWLHSSVLLSARRWLRRSKQPRLSGCGLRKPRIYAQRAIAAIWQASEQGLVLAQALEADQDLRQTVRAQFRGPEGDRLRATPYWEKLGPKALQLFREARVDPMALASDWDPTWPEDPVQSSVVTLREAVESSNLLATELQNWGPEAEKPETPGFWDVD